MKNTKELSQQELGTIQHRARKLMKNHGSISPAMIVAKFQISLHHAYPIAKHLMKE